MTTRSRTVRRVLALGALTLLLFSLPSCYGFGWHYRGGPSCGPGPRLWVGPVFWPRGGRCR